MPSDTLPIMKDLIFSYTKRNRKITIYPIIHDELMFSSSCSKILEYLNPDCIALEIPFEMEKEMNIAINRLPAFTLLYNGDNYNNKALAYIIHPAEAIYWMAYLGRERKKEIKFIDIQDDEMYHKWGIGIGYYELASIGWKKFWNISKRIIDLHKHEKHGKRSHLMANKILKLNTDNNLAVIGAAHWPIIHQILLKKGYKANHSVFDNDLKINYDSKHEFKVSDKSWTLADIHPHTIHLSSRNLPFHISEMMQSDLDGRKFDMLNSIRKIYFEAEKIYREKFDDRINIGNYIRLFQYLRNLCRVERKVLPDLFDMIIAAKGMVDDDYAYEVFKTAIVYTFKPNKYLKNEIKFSPNEKQGKVINFAFKRRFKRPLLKEMERDEFDPFPEEKYIGYWKDIWDEYEQKEGYVSYPPEDEFLEKYLRLLEKKIENILLEELSSTEEFKTSLEDGIDWRETIINYKENKIYVKKYPKITPKIGSIIVQFIEEPIDTKYNHYTSLYAEHDKESHLSILTTEIAKEFVGPGICRVKYAALISQYPPLGIPVRISNTKDDLKLRLIYAAMNMSLSNIIGFISPKPPTAAHKYFASEYGFRLVYLPMIQLSKTSMNRLKTMHLLANKSLRSNAREYIGF